MRNFFTSERPFTLCRNLIKLAMTSAFLVVVDVSGWVGGCVGQEVGVEIGRKC